MAAHLSKAQELDYEQFQMYIQEQVEKVLDNPDVLLRDATEQVVSEIFEELRGNSEILSAFLARSNEFFDEPFTSGEELEEHLKDSVCETIHDDEIYMAQKTGTEPRANRTSK